MLILQCFCGLIAIVASALYFARAKRKDMEKVNEVNLKTRSITDYTILYHNLPFEDGKYKVEKELMNKIQHEKEYKSRR